MISADCRGYTGSGSEPPARQFDLPTPVVPPRTEAPSPAALRRVLRRARDGVALNVDEAAIAMTARGDDLADLCASAARVRDAGLESAGRRGADRPAAGQLLAQGLHPGHPPVPRHLPLLHVRHGARQAARRGQGHVPGARRDPRRRPPRCRIGLQGSAVHPRRPSGGAVARGPAVARRARLRLDAGLRARDGDPGARGDRSAAAPESRRDELVGAVAAQAGRAVDGHDARDHVAAAVRDARAWRTTAARTRIPTVRLRTLDRRRPAVDPVHHRTAGRHRRDPDRARRDHARDPPVCTRSSATSRK